MKWQDVWTAFKAGTLIALLTQTDSAQASGLRGAKTGDDTKALASATDEQSMQEATIGTITTAGRELEANITDASGESFSTVAAQDQFLITPLVKVTEEDVQTEEALLKRYGNQTAKITGNFSLPDDVIASMQSERAGSESDRRELVYLNDNLICLNTGFSATFKDPIVGDRVKFKITDLIKDGKTVSVATENPCVQISFELQNGGFLTAAIGELTAADLAASSCKIDNMPLKKFHAIEVTFYDTYTDPTHGTVPNVIKMSVYKPNENIPGGLQVAAVLMQAPGKLKHIAFPWSPRGSVPAVYDIERDTLQATAAPVTNAPVGTKTPTVATTTTRPPTKRPVTVPNTSGAPTASGTSTAPTASGTVSTVKGTTTPTAATTVKAQDSAEANTTSDDSAGKVVGGIVGTVAAAAAVAAGYKKFGDKFGDRKDNKAPQTKAESPLAKPPVTALTPFASSNMEAPRPAAKPGASTAVAKSSEAGELPTAGRVAQLREKFEKKGKDNSKPS